MNSFHIFEGRSIDDAIAAACRTLACPREALEVDILRVGSTGIFGFGAKKAQVKARKRPAPADQTQKASAPSSATVSTSSPHNTQKTSAKPRQAPPAKQPPQEKALPQSKNTATASEDMLRQSITQTITSLLKPLVDDCRFTLDLRAGIAHVLIDDREYSGLIIGREGQTITSLQYLANRIVSRKHPNCPRIQIDSGDYRKKQQEQLHSLALSLAQKVKTSGKIQSTRPLSSYHRRIVHMALQNEPGVQTRSKGDGPLKRVLILPDKKRSAATF